MTKVRLIRSEIADVNIDELKSLGRGTDGALGLFQYEGQNYTVHEISFTIPYIKTEPEYTVLIRKVDKQ